MATTDLSFEGRYLGPQQLISSPQDCTGTWADLGSEYKLAGARKVALYAELDINSSNNAQVRFLAKHAAAHADEFVLPITTTGTATLDVEDQFYEFASDADQKVMLTVDLGGCVFYGQWQVRVNSVGGTAAQFDDAWIMSSL